MGVELRPLGVACNIACTYCYQNPQREAGNYRQDYDLERMKTAVEREGGPFTLFGGEPLLMPHKDLEILLAWGLEKYGSNSIQTNGALITDEHIELFRKYKVTVGVSIDGPGELNDVRRSHNREVTRATTAAVEAAIEKLCQEHEPPGLIVTLHQGNALPEKLPRMHAWMRRLDDLGIKSVRLHILEVENTLIRDELALSGRQNYEAFTGFIELQEELKNVRFDIADELEQLLMGNDGNASCVWHACDLYTTAAVRGVEGNGQSSNCGRTNKDGVDFVKANEPGYERYLALYHTPQTHGGCSNCRFFLFCKGQCPGTAIDGDWRNRTEHCRVWMALFTTAESNLVRKGMVPISLQPIRLELEQKALAVWRGGDNLGVSDLQTRDAL